MDQRELRVERHGGTSRAGGGGRRLSVRRVLFLYRAPRPSLRYPGSTKASKLRPSVRDKNKPTTTDQGSKMQGRMRDRRYSRFLVVFTVLSFVAVASGCLAVALDGASVALWLRNLFAWGVGAVVALAVFPVRLSHLRAHHALRRTCRVASQPRQSGPDGGASLARRRACPGECRRAATAGHSLWRWLTLSTISVGSGLRTLCVPGC